MKNKNLLLLLPALVLAVACTPSNSESSSTSSTSQKPGELFSNYSYGVFHSYVAWSFVSSEGDYGAEIKEFCERLDDLADPYYEMKGENNLYTLNHSSDFVELDPVLFDLLKLSVELQEKTEGYFNPFIGDISTLWKLTLFGAEDDFEFTGPDAATIRQAEDQIPSLLEKMNSSSMLFDEKNHKVKRIGEATIDLGGLTKGYAVEQIERIIDKYESTVYLINGGQSSVGFGKSSAESGNFKANLMYSKTKGEFKYEFQNIDSSTSAVYEQWVKVNGTLYSHVINPKTGLPITPYSMAFLTGQDSALLDAFSTSCMLAGPEKAKEWGERYGFDYALFSDDGGYIKLEVQSDALADRRIYA